MIIDQQQVQPGTKTDAGKCRMDLLPPVFLEGTACVLTKGAEKYGDRNWEKGMSWSRVFGALMRHLWKWWAAKLLGTNGTDPEWEFSHLWHAGCCLAFLMHYESHADYSSYDDRPEFRGNLRTRESSDLKFWITGEDGKHKRSSLCSCQACEAWRKEQAGRRKGWNG